MLSTAFEWIKHPSITGSVFMGNTSAPHAICRVYTFEESSALNNFINTYNLSEACVKLLGYQILLRYIGTKDLIREKPVLGHLILQEIKNAFESLRTFYLTNRIKGNETR